MSIEFTRNSSVAPAATPPPMTPAPWRVTGVRHDTYDTFTLNLLRVDPENRFSFQPGQFNMLYLPGVGEVPISISGDPEAAGPVVHTIRAVGPVTRAMSSLRRGQSLGLRGPYGTGWPVTEARGRDVIIVAGGIGLAPLRPALYYLLNHREDYDRVTLLYGARTPRDILYRRELETWRGRFDLQAAVTVDAAPDDWRGEVGLVTGLIPRAQFDADNVTVMICGPEIMMRFTCLGLAAAGIPAESVYVSMERNMKCGVGLCGHCQLGGVLICRDGPVFRYDAVAQALERREL